ncbi:MAG: hypothetical protein CVT63_06420 [Candidatus Anoxymicrobium japonicum]|uniref:Peptidase M48 domain-containing protein n=1 Tax=Candidatus Anoxymicrobium japonicum TaxID=2013648 RepID=A0A2N3G4T1_9ACTN|nr:MAG: hypothetical protein CVT63_06420 [Candidatus Anoxymicrobium japonicum]
MSFEPKVLESIKEYKKKDARERLLLILPLVLVVAFGFVLLVAGFVFRGDLTRTYDPMLDWGGSGVMFIKVIAAVLMIFLLAGAAYDLWFSIRYAQSCFELFVNNQTLDCQPDAFMKFEEALQGASIAAGVEPPGLVVFDDPAVNAAAFIDADGNRMVGITAGMLKADISVNEANGVMAHELAHLIIDNSARMPALFDLEFLPALFLIAFGVFASLAIISAPSNLGYAIAVTLAIAAAVFVIIIVEKSQRFLMRLLDLSYKHDDMLADSIAVTITRDPVALASAIELVAAFAGESQRTPGGTILSRYMFVTAPMAQGDYFRYATEVASEMLTWKKQPRTWLLFQRPTNKAERKLLDLEQDGTHERLINLDMIRQGRRRAFVDWESD